MVKKILKRGRKLFSDPQESVISAATIIMLMVIASRVLGLIRQRTLAAFFNPSDLALFFAAFRLPDLVFEVLVYGTFSSAFIPVFTKTLEKGNRKAWKIASTVVNLGLLVFILFSIIIGIAADPLYALFAPGFSGSEREIIVSLTRILFAAQGFFVISYVLTGVLESLRRFLVPALAPLFYNIGIIAGTVLLSPKLGLLGPALGVFLGALAHFLIQLPLAVKLGFRFELSINLSKEVKKIGKLAAPRVLEVSFLQVQKLAELFFASLISTAAYTYFTFGNSLQLLPVGLFGTSIAKAALPTLSRQEKKLKEFRKTLLSSLYEIVFLVLPLATILIVLRIPVVRLIYGTDIFGWEATVQTGMVLSAFGFGVVFHAAVALLARSFYALNDTKTPVIVSIVSIALSVAANFIFIRVFNLPAWGLAAAFSIGAAFQAIVLFYLINKRVIRKKVFGTLIPIFKSGFAAFVSGAVMYVLLKLFDRSVWIKRLGLLGKIEGAKALNFERFVLDTRYTINLLILTLVVSLIGATVYVIVSFLLRNRQLWTFADLVKRVITKRKVDPVPKEETETVAPVPTDSSA